MAEPTKPALPSITTWQAFLADTAPYATRRVQAPSKYSRRSGTTEYFEFSIPDVRLWCSVCGGERLFRSSRKGMEVSDVSRIDGYHYFTCKNCDQEVHTFSLRLGPAIDCKWVTAIKFGQSPRFGLRLPSAVEKLIVGDDAALLKKALVAEGEGLGIGAFTYYRRILDNQRGRIFERLIEAVKALGGSEDVINELYRAKSERQFTKAVEEIKHALPAFLFIEGHNPLTLLYDAVSNGLHAESDADCLASAQAIRSVLGHLLAKVDEALQSDDEVRSAVSRLLAAKEARRRKSSGKPAQPDLEPDAAKRG